MKNFSIKTLHIVSFFIFVPALLSASPSGRNSGMLLEVESSARLLGMGGGSAGLAEGVEAVSSNPAGLANMYGNQLEFSHVRYYMDSTLNTLSYAGRVSMAAIAARLKYFSSSDIVRSDVGIESESFDIDFSQYSFTYAFPITEDNNLGFNFHYLKEKIYESDGTAYAYDIGWHYTDVRNSSFGMVLRNLGSQLKLENRAARLPTELAIGGAHWMGAVMLLWEFSADDLDNIKWNFGMETELRSIKLRSGLINNYKTSLAFGFGLPYNKTYFDYAYVPHHELGQVHRLSLGIVF